MNKKGITNMFGIAVNFVFTYWWVILIFAILYFGFIYSGSLISIQGLQPITKTDTWNTYPLLITTPYLGSLTSYPDREICGDNDGGVLISNSYSIQGSLILSTSTSGKQDCSGNNVYIEADVPAGILSGSCDVSSSASGNSGGSPTGSSCEVVGLYSLSAKSCDPHVSGCNAGNQQQTGNFNFPISSPTKLKFRVTSDGIGAGGSSAKLTLNFVPDASAQENPQQTTTTTNTPAQTSTGQTSASTQNLTFFDRLSNNIKKALDWLFGWFK